MHPSWLEVVFDVAMSVLILLMMIALFALAIAALVRAMRFAFDLFDLW